MDSLQTMEPEHQENSRIISIKQMVGSVWNLGLITYGGPMSHIGVLKTVFVQKLKTIDSDRFTELLTISQSLPGPTSTQLLICTSIYSTASLLGGIVSFILFSLPTFLAMFAAAIFLSTLQVDSTVNDVLRGFRIVSVAIILQAFWGLSSKYRKSYKSVFLFIFSALTYRMFPYTQTIIVLFVVGGIFSFYSPLSTQNMQKNNAINTSSRFSNCLFGKKNIAFFLILLGGSILTSIFYSEASDMMENRLLQTVSTFYRIGSIVIGGGHVILPMMWSEFQKYGYFNQEAYWNGFSMISCMPGPMFNLSVYMGTLVTKNIFGALAAFVGLYTPCFLFVLFILPHWQVYREKRRIKRIIDGMCCISVGLILTAAIILWEKSCLFEENNSTKYGLSLIVMACFLLLEIKNWNIVAVLFLGQSLYLGFYYLLMIQ